MGSQIYQNDDDHPVNDDAIIGTTYSKNWIRDVIARTKVIIDKYEKKKQGQQKYCIKVTDITSVKMEFGQLLYMTRNSAVQKFFYEDANGKTMETILWWLLKGDFQSEQFQITQITIGILVNLLQHNGCFHRFCKYSEPYTAIKLAYLSQRNIPLLIDTLHNLTTFLSVSSGDDVASIKMTQFWLYAIKRHSHAFFPAITFVLANCLNVKVLKLTLDLANRLVNRGEPLQVFEGGDSDSVEVNFGALWLAAVKKTEEVEEKKNPERKRISAISALNIACSTLLCFKDLSDRGGGTLNEKEKEEEEKEVEAVNQYWEVARTPANLAFFRHFWFIISGLYSSPLFTTAHFDPADLRSLSKFFRCHGGLLLLGEPDTDFVSNFPLAFSAPCTFFARMVRSIQLESTNTLCEIGNVAITVESNKTLDYVEENLTAFSSMAQSIKKQKKLRSEIRRLQQNLADSPQLVETLEKAKEITKKAILETKAKKENADNGNSNNSFKVEEDEDEDVIKLLEEALNWMKYFGVVVMGQPAEELGWLTPEQSDQLSSSSSSRSSLELLNSSVSL